MHPTPSTETARYARAIESSKRARWDIDVDVIRGRQFDFSRRFLPDGLSHVDRMEGLTNDERRLMSQIQGRTYANLFGLVERFINAKVLEVSRDHWLGDQVALEALVRFSAEEIKHQELFRRLEGMMADGMAPGYHFVPRPDDVATAVLSKSTWAVLALTCHIEIFVLAHYRASIEPEPEMSDLFRDVFRFHWQEEAQHAVLDELEWRREDGKLDAEARDRAVDDLIALVSAVDGILQVQAAQDVDYFTVAVGRPVPATEVAALNAAVLRAYRWQYILSGVQEKRFTDILGSLITEAQLARISRALAPLMA